MFIDGMNLAFHSIVILSISASLSKIRTIIECPKSNSGEESLVTRIEFLEMKHKTNYRLFDALYKLLSLQSHAALICVVVLVSFRPFNFINNLFCSP